MCCTRKSNTRRSRQLILASTSPRRIELLKLIVPGFKAVAPNVSREVVLPRDPVLTVITNSLAKASSVAFLCGNGEVVLSADTVVYKDIVLGKPANEQDAYRMLKELSGKWHAVYTGFAIIDKNSGKVIVGYDVALVKFACLTEEMICWYLSTREYKGKAGSYAVQGAGGVLVEKIIGHPSTVIGLPIHLISTELRRLHVI